METTDNQSAVAPIVPPAVIAAATADARSADATTENPAGRPADVPTVIDWNLEATQFIEFAHELYTPLWPSLDKVYTPAVRARVATRAAPVFKKYDFNLAKLFGRYGDEIMLGAVLVPLVPATLAAIRHDRLMMEAAAKGSTNAQAQVPAQAQTATVAAAPGAAATPAVAAASSPLDRFNDASADSPHKA